jgi:arylsulfatase A-like enzyme
MLDETIVIVTSDHGESLGEHGRIDHTLNMYETTLHIPLVIRYPAAFEPGDRVQKLVSLVDIAPTLIDLCDIKHQLDTKEEERSLSRPTFVDRSFVIATNERPLTGIKIMKKNYPDFDVSTIDYRLGAIRTKDYKLMNNIGGTIELYDMNEDPAEINDLGHAKVDIRDKLLHILTSWRKNMMSESQKQLHESQDQESLELLRSLGYVE